MQLFREWRRDRGENIASPLVAAVLLSREKNAATEDLEKLGIARAAT